MTQPWPPYIYRSFESARLTDPSGTNESTFYGPYMRLLYTLFPLDGNFEVVPQYKEKLIDPQDSRIDFATVFVVELNRHPVFFLQLTPPAALHFASKRRNADKQMRSLFGNLMTDLAAIPVLHGISTFGTRLSFYRYDAASNQVQPQPQAEFITDIAPLDPWDCDVLEMEGATRLKQVIEHVMQMCA